MQVARVAVLILFSMTGIAFCGVVQAPQDVPRKDGACVTGGTRSLLSQMTRGMAHVAGYIQSGEKR